MSTRNTFTDADLERLPRDGRKYELVDGEVRMSPAGARHGQVIVSLTVRLATYVETQDLGVVLESSTGYRLPNGNVRSPDLSFVARARIDPGQLPDGFLDLAPDLAVEVVSPGENDRDVLDKVGEFLAAGVQLVWIIDFRKRRAAAFRSLTDVREVTEEGFLDGGQVVPGFRVRLADLLQGPRSS